MYSVSATSAVYSVSATSAVYSVSATSAVYSVSTNAETGDTESISMGGRYQGEIIRIDIAPRFSLLIPKFAASIAGMDSLYLDNISLFEASRVSGLSPQLRKIANFVGGFHRDRGVEKRKLSATSHRW